MACARAVRIDCLIRYIRACQRLRRGDEGITVVRFEILKGGTKGCTK